ncbi:hypothetical protein, partial [Xenorhabdus entomophaga]|uniref:hypothetical protein n=1 Tax=Xenorhabdus entomophaga TaxID=3136257 RepID=UPI0030F399BC
AGESGLAVVLPCDFSCKMVQLGHPKKRLAFRGDLKRGKAAVLKGESGRDLTRPSPCVTITTEMIANKN